MKPICDECGGEFDMDSQWISRINQVSLYYICRECSLAGLWRTPGAPDDDYDRTTKCEDDQ